MRASDVREIVPFTTDTSVEVPPMSKRHKLRTPCQLPDVRGTNHAAGRAGQE